MTPRGRTVISALRATHDHHRPLVKCSSHVKSSPSSPPPPFHPTGAHSIGFRMGVCCVCIDLTWEGRNRSPWELGPQPEDPPRDPPIGTRAAANT